MVKNFRELKKNDVFYEVWYYHGYRMAAIKTLRIKKTLTSKYGKYFYTNTIDVGPSKFCAKFPGYGRFDDKYCVATKMLASTRYRQSPYSCSVLCTDESKLDKIVNELRSESLKICNSMYREQFKKNLG